MDKIEVKVRIQGQSPLIYTKFLGENERNNSLNPRDAAIRHLHYLNDPEKGNPVYIPGNAIFACLVNAGKFHKINGRQATTGKESRVPDYLKVKESAPLLYRGYGSQVTHYSGWDVETNRVWSGHTCLESHRPRVEDWYCAFTLIVYNGFDLEKARELLTTAGMKIGLLGFRPQKKGPYGKFTIINWEPGLRTTDEENFSRMSEVERVS